jgi:hypothetical protein
MIDKVQSINRLKPEQVNPIIEKAIHIIRVGRQWYSCCALQDAWLSADNVIWPNLRVAEFKSWYTDAFCEQLWWNSWYGTVEANNLNRQHRIDALQQMKEIYARRIRQAEQGS